MIDLTRGGLDVSVTCEIDSLAICRRDGHSTGNWFRETKSELKSSATHSFTSGSFEDSTEETSDIFADS